MTRYKIGIMLGIIYVLIAVVLSGCSVQPEPDVAKTENVNQTKMSPNSNNISANSLNVPTPTARSNTYPETALNKQSSPPVKEPKPQIGSGAGDMFLFTQVRSSLSSDKELFNSVIVEIKEGNATLSGKVSSAAQKAKAEQILRSVKGIKSVKNSLIVF